MDAWDILIIIFIITVVIVVGLYLLNKWSSKRIVEQKSLIERTRQPASIYVIDKKKDKLQNANFPKVVQEQLPKWNKLMKMHLVKAKVGPQIMTLMCDKEVFGALPIKKTVKVELAGIYIASMSGMKSKKEMAERKGGVTPWYRRLTGR